MSVARNEDRGLMYGSLMVLGLATIKRYKNSEARILCCVCKCGNLCLRYKGALTRGKVTTCGCGRMSTAIGHKSPNWSGSGHVSGTYFARVKRNAQYRGLEFDISAEYMDGIFTAQGGICALTGVSLKTWAGGGGVVHGQTASLDRIESDKGYIKGNIQWVHKKINAMKMDLSQKDFIELCTLVAIKAGTVRPLND